jgi:prepilin-type N-terminal cleavage/methylation domain-containing protein
MTNNMHALRILFVRAIARARGFTLIETMVAVLLLSSAIAGPLTIASKGLSAALIARDQMIAFYLAQDAVEYVRFVRDSNRLNGDPWLTSLSACTGTDGCTLDPSAGTVAACSGACDLIKKYDDGSSHVYFSYTLGNITPQQFRRTVTLAAPQSGGTTEEVLTVSVAWRAQSGVTRTISVRENILDWQ